MKTRIILIIGILLLSGSLVNSKESGKTLSESAKGNFTVFSTPDLNSLTVRLVNEYKNLNPGVIVNVKTQDETEIAGLLQSSSDIGFITDQSLSAMKNLTPWNMVIGRDVIVPLMHKSNPLREEIFSRGISPEMFTKLLNNPEIQSWEALLGNLQKKANLPLHYYFVNEPSVIKALSHFTNSRLLNKSGYTLTKETDLITAIENDPFGIGFCSLKSVTEQTCKYPESKIILVPVDKNGNGKLDYNEAIYENTGTFARGVWIGKYPMALSGKIYSVASTKPTGASERTFLKWVLTDGQRYLTSSNYSTLVQNERESQLSKIDDNQPINNNPSNPGSSLKFILFILTAIVITMIIMEIVARQYRKKIQVKPSVATLQAAFNEGDTDIPKGFYFDNTHTWTYMKKDGIVKVGIDDFLQHVTGAITKVEMKMAGEYVKKGEYLFTLIQKGKQLRIYSPVTGKIIENNTNLITNAGLLNTSPFEEGWIYRIEPANWIIEIQFMNMAEKYTNWIKGEYTRLKDFFEAAVRVHVPAFVMVLQDGGVLRDGILSELGPEIWEDFQTKFIDLK